jgi:hypothetical protein
MELGPLQGAVLVRATTAAALRFDKEAVPTFFKHAEEGSALLRAREGDPAGSPMSLVATPRPSSALRLLFTRWRLQLLGVDHKSLAWDRDGIERRITILHGRVADGVLG